VDNRYIIPLFIVNYHYFKDENNAESTEPAVDAASLVVFVAVEEALPRRPLRADFAAEVAADVATDDAIEFVSRFAIEPRALSTEFELLVVTRLLEPVIRLERNEADVF